MLHTDQYLEAPLERVFAFFADAMNLERLTPSFLKFRVLTPAPIEMREGALIDYRLRLHGVPIRWRTLISRWEPGVCFIDEQIKGPYKKWVHLHTFAREGTGTRVRDRVEYELPLAWAPGSGLVHRWFVRPRLDEIFAFRAAEMERVVGEMGARHAQGM